MRRQKKYLASKARFFHRDFLNGKNGNSCKFSLEMLSFLQIFSVKSPQDFEKLFLLFCKMQMMKYIVNDERDVRLPVVFCYQLQTFNF